MMIMIKLNYPKFWQHRSLISYLLLPLSIVYFFGATIRRLVNQPQRLPAKVICIGNITIGGTGKTQVAIWLARHFKEDKIKFVILCKGYDGSYLEPTAVTKDMSPDFVGDEALELCAHGTTIVAKKVIDAIPLLQKLAPDVIIVDDGMQNPSFIKDYILAVVDGDRGFGNRMLFPAGPMRQFVKSGIEAADEVMVVSSATGLFPSGLTRVSQASRASQGPQFKREEKSYKATIKPLSNFDLSKKYYAFAGIGNPERFFNSAKNQGLDIVATKAFPDHNKYSKGDIAFLKTESDKLGAKLLTTRKDWVKIRDDNITSFDVTLEIDKEKELIDKIYEKILPRN